MRIAIFALGSRGDVQPYIALGKGLKEAGHVVRLVTHENFETLVHSHGLEFWNAHGNVQDVIESEDMQALLAKGNFIAITRHTAKLAESAALQWAKDGLAACEGMDLLIAGIGGLFVGLSLAEKLNIPLLQAYLAPLTPTRDFPSPVLPPGLPNLGGSFNRLTHQITQQMMWQGFRSADKMARRNVLGLPPAPFRGPHSTKRAHELPTLYGFSQSVISKPRDWGDKVHVTGFWFLDSAEAWSPPSDLMNFLESGPAPVYIGFGSMSNRKPEETAELIIQSLRRSNQRAVLFSGWNGLRKTDIPDSIIMIDSVPHEWLFPRVAAVVHHGGAGTTAAGLKAGIPSIVIPFFGDQPFWGGRVADLGVGPIPIPRKKLTAERLASAIQQAVTNQEMRRRAVALGSKIQAEDGIARAVEIIEQQVLSSSR